MRQLLPTHQAAPRYWAEVEFVVWDKARRAGYVGTCVNGHCRCATYDGGPCFEDLLRRAPELREMMD